MHWYVIHTKPRQERRAWQNLVQQGYECYLPLMPRMKLRAGDAAIVEEPLFPRYLFVQLDDSLTGKGWAPIRSTKGVSRLVTFGAEPATVSDDLLGALRRRQDAARPAPLYAAGDQVRIATGAFSGLDAVYLMDDGERRAMVLIELLNRPLTVNVPRAIVRKIA
ncbi:transcription/translation regulatory transformer protein RfaH [Lacisediminimonas sp.]|uniref:transcription/translation regulatory transformer protein RfaH n=1 Tax=Lacisediminimonas sp. TaxID=3060582 RepID=UPI00272795D1|nr:transcription/translation regulatory transformer protein RfaH [Lacisediminimonas sp.]MDO8298689.1 transcription/translation regulatory transformer protein RfaH [Lacisediminimonas sp.]MDO9217678.1 transcription/translation regulatory transformer protein RfaH [Lacisediminimonas sp.]